MVRIIGIVAGCVLGFGLFYAVDAIVPDAISEKSPPFIQYSGTVTLHDVQNGLIRISTPSVHSFSKPPGDVQFSYDDETLWGSLEYTFENNVAVKQKLALGKSIQLPAGTLVTVQRDPFASMPFRASVVIFLKRTIL